MTMNRREAFQICALGGFSLAAGASQATAQRSTANEDRDFCGIAEGLITSGNPLDAVAAGSKAPKPEDRVAAFRILASAPTSAKPYDVAKYFADLKHKGTGGPFNQEWTDYYNPVIFGFLAMTLSSPFKGDETHWCAAFVNYCLLWSKYQGTQSLASASFRSWTNLADKGTDKPEKGDLAVFRNIGLDGAPMITGHVAFYEEMDEAKNEVRCLGGNQGGGSFNGGGVSVDKFPIKRVPNKETKREGRELVGFVSLAKIPRTSF